MTLSAGELGPIGDLAKALGVFDGDGDVRVDWFSDPGKYLKTTLSNAEQREALVSFIDEALGGEERETGPDGFTWLPLFNHADPKVGVYLVIDDAPASEVHLGVGIRFETEGPDSKTNLHVPLFRAAKSGSVDPLLLGAVGGAIRFGTEIVLDAGTPAPGAAFLGGIGLGLRVPTASGDGNASVSLRLSRQQLPGTTGLRDFNLSVDELDELDDQVLELVLGLVRAQAEAVGSGQLAALAGMLGLTSGGGVPALPLSELTSRGAEALASWFRGVMSNPTTRTAWLGEVAGLLGGAANVAGDEVRFSFGDAALSFGALVATNAGGQPIVTPVLAATVTQGNLRARAEAQLARLDLGTGAAFALPGLAVFAQFGSAGTPILAGDPGVQALRVGFVLDAERRANALLAADGVTLAGRTYPSLDLSTPEALAELGGSLLTNVVSDLLGQLGPAGTLIPPLLGLAPPPGAAAAGTLDLGEFLQNPLDAIRRHWLKIVRDHAAAIPGLLEIVRGLIADAGADALITGTGTEIDPWKLELVRHVAFELWRDPSGEQLELGFGAHYFQDELGPGCTRVEADLRAGIARFDLARPSADFAAFVQAKLTARARGAARTTIAVLPAVTFDVDHVGLAATWRPEPGFSVRVLAPNLVATVGSQPVPIELPTFGPDGRPNLDAAGWAALEILLGIAGSVEAIPWLRQLTSAFGWSPRDRLDLPIDTPQLKLSELMTDPEATIRAALSSVLLQAAGPIEALLETIAMVLTGNADSFGQLLGRGRPRDPYRLPLLPSGQAPSLVLWSEPEGPLGARTTLVAQALRDWRNGAPGLDVNLLEQILSAEANAGEDLRNLLASRPALAQGFEGLVTRWTGSDGRVVVPAALPSGIAVHRLADVTFDRLGAALDLAALLAAPSTIVRIALAPATGSAWPDAPADRRIDLDAPGLVPESFAIPLAASGEWFVSLAGRNAARLTTGDADGTRGQAERLKRVLAPFALLAGNLVLVADAATGHAARIAADEIDGVDALVLLGTPLGPVAFSVLDTQPAADALRLLSWLLPPVDPARHDDADLALGRSLVTALTSLLPLADPAQELTPPATLPPPRAGLALHVLAGEVSEAAARRSLTAIVAAGLARQARARSEHHAADQVTASRFGIRLPLLPATTGVSVSGDARIELCGVEAGVQPALSTLRALHLTLRVQRVGGWLVGGPDPERGPGPRPDHELRAFEAYVRVPFGAGQASAEIVLHEPRVFGVTRVRWVVRPTGSTSAADEIVTPALPEIGVLLSHAADALREVAAEPQVAALLELLRGVELIDASGGFVSDALAHLLHEPSAHLSAAVANATRRAQLTNACQALIGEIPGVTFDLAAKTLALELSGTPGDTGLLPFALAVEVAASGTARFDFRVGGTSSTAAGGAELVFTSHPLEARIDWHRPGAGIERIALWPADADALVRRVPLLALGEIGRGGLEFLRRLDEPTRPLIDAALDALGLLGAGSGVDRRVLPLLGLIADPRGFFLHETALGSAAGFDPGKLVAFLDAFRPILGVSGSPGLWQLANGVSVRADSNDGSARLAFGVDSGAFETPDEAPGRLVFGAEISLTLLRDQAPRPGLDLSIGLSGASPGRSALHVVVDGGLSVFLRPTAGADLPLFPNPPGLGRLAEVAVEQALPRVLDTLAAETGADFAGQVAAVVRAIGDLLALRVAGQFDGQRLSEWANDPAAAFAARLPTVASAALSSVATALDPLLPGSMSASVSAGGALQVSAGPVTVSLDPAPFAVSLAIDANGVPGVEHVKLLLELSEAGLDALVLTLGPPEIVAEGIVLRPLFGVAAGNAPAGGRRVDVGLGLEAAGSRYFAGRFNLDAPSFTMIAVDGAATHSDPESVALAMLEGLLQLAASFAMSTDALDTLLGKTLPRLGAGPEKSVRDVLRGVFLDDANPNLLAERLFDTSLLLERLRRLLANLGEAGPGVSISSNLDLGIGKTGEIVEFVLGIRERAELNPGDDVVISIEADSRWIRDQPPAGIAIGLFDASVSGFAFAPSLSVNGVGLRVSRTSAPLLDIGLTLGSIALHLFGRVSATEFAGGVQVQLSNLAVGVASAQGGNAVAQGIMQDAGSGSERLAPAFSPALAIQKHHDTGVLVGFRAGDGDGPWWLVIQKGFGPVYIEQIGLGVQQSGEKLERITVLLDGGVSIAGLNAAVDDLGLTFTVDSQHSPFDPSRWRVELGGLAVSSDLGGITLAGGLRKFGDGDSVEYIGMLSAKFATYGLSVYGGYGTSGQGAQKFAAFFVFGAINGPIGGPPAFFITGIGGGLGINRGLEIPMDFARFGEFVMLKALDPSARAAENPMQELTRVREAFPMKRGEFWFAAGLSFNSFALVDGIAVLAVAFGDGLEIALVGLARMALPRPEIALVSIELGLLVRFSTKEGVLWVQAQLTDNSWLLHESVRLTGGFAFVIWFGGPNKGQFVITLGGYHPSFHRDGYPVVPRLGFSWRIGDFITIKGENYFALTSEALMAGGRLEASATLGPAWAHIVFGADGIVFFDPFRFMVEVYASISAGITIDVWIGEITISIHIGAKIKVEGPNFRGTATFEIGPCSLSVSFGDNTQSGPNYISWDAFVPKYLEEAGPGVGRLLSAIAGKGALPPGVGAGGATDTAVADGSAERPFEVLSEFELTVTINAPTRIIRADVTHDRNPSRVLGLAPLGKNNLTSELDLALLGDGGVNHIGKLESVPLDDGAFPVGVWGSPQNPDDKKVPKGDVINAMQGVRLIAEANPFQSLPTQIAYHQVEAPGPRKPLPFLPARSHRAALLAGAARVSELLPALSSGSEVYAEAKAWLRAQGLGATSLAALERERSAKPRVGSLSEGLAADEIRASTAVVQPAPAAANDTSVHAPIAIAVLTAPTARERALPFTSVSNARDVVVMAPPTLASVEAESAVGMSAKLVKFAPVAADRRETLAPTGSVPFTRTPRGSSAAVQARGSHRSGVLRLRAFSAGLGGALAATDGVVGAAGRAAAAPPPHALLHSGEIAVLRLPNAARDVALRGERPRLFIDGGSARVVALGFGGDVLADETLQGRKLELELPRTAERLVVSALGEIAAKAAETAAPSFELFGWHAGQELAYVGTSTALAKRAVVRVEGGQVQKTRQRFGAGWLQAAELVAGATLVTTRFADPVSSICVVVEAAGGDLDELAFELDGFRRVTGDDGRALAPTLATMGNRSLLVYAVAGEPGRAASVSITLAGSWTLAGVLASQQSPSEVAERLSRAGLDRALGVARSGGKGAVRVGWRPMKSEPPPVPGEPKKPHYPERTSGGGEQRPGLPKTRK